MNVGIDLGTTYSACAFINSKGEPEIAVNREGARLTPSVVQIEKDGNVIVGQIAKENSFIDPASTISYVKSEMGKMKTYSLPDGNGYTAEMISGFILNKIVQDSEEFIGQKIRGAIITIPAYFTDAQRKSTADAAEIAGINLLGMINEPTAAALYYAHKLGLNEKMNIMIYDIGGGTFDVTIISYDKGDVVVKSKHGLPNEGGRFLDQDIAKYVCDIFMTKHRIDLMSQKYSDEYQDLILKAENCKLQLSVRNTASITLKVGNIKENIEITRAFLEEKVAKIFLRTEGSVKKAVRDAGLTMSEIDKVVLVGGSSKIPYISEKIAELTGKQPSREVSPDEAVALGAAIYAARTKQDKTKTAQSKIIDVCSHSIGIVTIDRKTLEKTNTIIIPRNSQLPATGKNVFYLPARDQRQVEIVVTEGEFAELSDVTIIASIDVDLPPNIPHNAEIHIRFDLDINQLLHIFLEIPSMKLVRKFPVKREHNMSEEELRKQKGLFAKHNMTDTPKTQQPETQTPSDNTPPAKDESVKCPEVTECVAAQFKGIVGMTTAQVALTDYFLALQFKQERELHQISSEQNNTGFLIRGSTGTGKTLLAKTIARLLAELGQSEDAEPLFLNKLELQNLLNAKDYTLFSKYISENNKSVAVLENIDYLTQDDSSGNMLDCLTDTILHRKYTFIITGSGSGINRLLVKKPELRTFFLHDIKLPPYSPEQWVQIAQYMANQNRFQLSPDAEIRLIRHLKPLYQLQSFLGAKDIDVLLQKAIHQAAKRVTKLGSIAKKHLTTLEADDFPIETDNGPSVEELLAQLNSMVGLNSVKTTVNRMYETVKTTQKAIEQGFMTGNDRPMLHMAFKGNAGTGKTTVARIIGSIYKKMGLLRRGDVTVECRREDLVGQYKGHTAPKVAAKVNEAMGGVLFIDEVYSLVQGEGDTFGQEAIDTLIPLLIDHKDDLMVIIAGYSDDVDRFLAANPGLPRRFPHVVTFEDYTVEELTLIFHSMLKSRGKRMADGCDKLVHRLISTRSANKDFGNAGGVGNLVDALIDHQSTRINTMESFSEESFSLIQAEDVEKMLEKSQSRGKDEWLAQLHDMVGLKSVKRKVEEMTAQIKLDLIKMERGIIDKESHGNLHTVFLGNAGTGKTTVARILGGIYNALGLLPDGNKFTECKGLDLIGKYQGQTAPKVKAMFDKADGGVLFIDEAYGITQGGSSSFGLEVVSTMLTELINRKDSLMVILAGYTKEMNEFFETNQGLYRRFPNILTFEDYSIDELLNIAQNMLEKQKRIVPEDVTLVLRALLEKRSKAVGFGNAGGAENVVQEIMRAQSMRLSKQIESGTDLTDDELQTILPEDVKELLGDEENV